MIGARKDGKISGKRGVQKFRYGQNQNDLSREKNSDSQEFKKCHNK